LTTASGPYAVTVPQGTLHVTVTAATYDLYHYPQGFPRPSLDIYTTCTRPEQHLTVRGRLYSCVGNIYYINDGDWPYRWDDCAFEHADSHRRVGSGTATWLALTDVMVTAAKQFMTEQPQWWRQSLLLGRARHLAAADTALQQARDELNAIEDVWQRWMHNYRTQP
jgi:hypothetical protein